MSGYHLNFRRTLIYNSTVYAYCHKDKAIEIIRFKNFIHKRPQNLEEKKGFTAI